MCTKSKSESWWNWKSRLIIHIVLFVELWRKRNHQGDKMEENEGRQVEEGEEEDEEDIHSARHSKPHGVEMSHIQLVDRAASLPRMVQHASDSEEDDAAPSQHLEHTHHQDHRVRSSHILMTHSATSQHPLHIASPPPGQCSSPSPQGVCACLYVCVFLCVCVLVCVCFCVCVCVCVWHVMCVCM